MSDNRNRRWLLARRPAGMLQESDFRWSEVEVPAPGEGQILVRNLYLSLDPAMRGWMDDRPSYVAPVALGAPMRGGAVGQVVESRNAAYQPGELVYGVFGWQDYCVAGPRGGVTRVPAGVPPALMLSVLGITGLTAYFGLLELGRPQPGETVVVSGAAGATGSVAGQIARIKGCRAVGIAGGAEKCRWCLEEARFDAMIDYKAEDVSGRLGELCPDGVHVYFDNVGGPILEAALAHIADRARIVLCGSISGYNAGEPPPGPRNLANLVVRRARMEGFLVIDYLSRFREAARELGEWVAAGEIAHREDVQEGLENAPRALLRLFRGENVGKQLLKLADPPLPVTSESA